MTDDIQVRDNRERTRYEIWLDGEFAGSTQYAVHGREVDFVHTEIGEEYGGRGLGSQLIAAALDDTRRQGRQAMPYCPFVRDFIGKHAEYHDLVPAQHHARFGLTAGQ